MSILSQPEKLRYHRHLVLEQIGEAGQLKIKNARVLVVGAGGLGCPVIQYLTSTGVGRISIADNDVVDVSNLQRQVFYGTGDLGKHKSIIACGKMRKTNSHIELKEIVSRVDYTNVRKLLAEHDVVVDCTDNIQARYVLNDGCILENKPLVHASVYKTQGQLSVFNYTGGPSYRCLFPEPVTPHEEKTEELGIYSVLPGILGLMQANEVLKIILGNSDVLSGKLLVYNAFTSYVSYLHIKKNPDNFIPEIIANNF